MLLSTRSVPSCTLGPPPCYTGWAFFSEWYLCHPKAQPILLLSSLAPLYKHLKFHYVYHPLRVRCPNFAAQLDICTLFHIAAVHTVMCTGDSQVGARACACVNATQSCLCNNTTTSSPPTGRWVGCWIGEIFIEHPRSPSFPLAVLALLLPCSPPPPVAVHLLCLSPAPAPACHTLVQCLQTFSPPFQLSRCALWGHDTRTALAHSTCSR